jgi:hypothetical protein
VAGCGFLASSAEADMLAMMARCSRPQSIQATLHIHLYPKSWTGKLTGAAEILYAIAGCCACAASGHAAAPPRSVMKSRRFMLDMGISPLSYGVPAEDQDASDDAWFIALSRWLRTVGKSLGQT